jgi:hypothetical protein
MPASMVVPFEARSEESLGAGSLTLVQPTVMSTQEMISEYREGVKFRLDDPLLALGSARKEEKRQLGPDKVGVNRRTP